MNIDRILLATDFSPCAQEAFAPAASLARRLKVGIDLVHVFGSPPLGFEIVGFEPGVYREGLVSRLEETCRQPVFAGLETKPMVLEGFGAEAIRKHLEGGPGTLVAIATHGRTGLKHLLLGSFTERLLRTVSSPVLTLRGTGSQAEFHPRRILFPYDFSIPARAALDTVRFFADTFGATVMVYHVLASEVLPVPGVPAELIPAREIILYMERAQDLAYEKLKELAAEELWGRKVEVETSMGTPVNAIVRKAGEAKADLVIMATHGRTGLGHAFLGSVAEGVVRRAPCSTITVRSRP